LVKGVLDNLYEQLPDKDEYIKDDLIKKRLLCLREDYRNLINGIIPLYDDLYKCFAYLYCYAAAHANVIYELIKLSSNLWRLFNSDRVHMSCLGGGPGCDLLGVQ